MDQPVDYQILGHEKLEPVLLHEAVLGQSAQGLPGFVAEPAGLRIGEGLP